ncbi:MAG: polyphosphate polymerase domain-containing protein [Chitinophagaceae bacterium]|nr:polyphosphate polymerase domain-containing protein [Chitinophagaceae bacterium]
MDPIESILNDFKSVSLAELDRVKLQNRIDSKYIMTRAELALVLKGIQAEQLVLEIDHKRLFEYKTIYFDTPDFQFFKDHHNGCINRVKVRCREYVDSHLCFYEIKRKLYGTRTDKQRLVIANLFHEVPETEYKLIQYKRLEQKPIEKKLSNSFQRITLTNIDFTERITIDLGIQFSNGNENMALNDIVVIEVKQGKSNHFSNTIQVLKSLGIRPSGFSKYAIGVSLLYPEIKHNNFNPILRNIHKLEHHYGNNGTNH